MLGAVVVLAVALLFVAGCGQASSDQSSALEAQQQENEELQKELEAQKREQEEAEDQETAEQQEEMQERIDELEQQVEENEGQQQTPQPEQDQPQPEPDVVIESNPDWTAPPSQAAEGVVVVSPDFDVSAVTTEEAEAIDAAIAYYQAVEVGDYYRTHSLLSVEDQSLFPLDEWVAANTALDSEAGEYVVTGAYPDSVGNYSPTYAVTVTVYLTDGSSFDRTTFFTDEGNGYWAHWLSQEEMDLFNGAL